MSDQFEFEFRYDLAEMVGQEYLVTIKGHILVTNDGARLGGYRQTEASDIKERATLYVLDGGHDVAELVKHMDTERWKVILSEASIEVNRRIREGNGRG